MLLAFPPVLWGFAGLNAALRAAVVIRYERSQRKNGGNMTPPDPPNPAKSFSQTTRS
jgi:hypothetical protein